MEIREKFGPVFQDHRTPDAVIQPKLDAGETAANEIRQAEEEWLLDICRAFGVRVVIRQINRPHKYDRSELAAALAAYLKDAKIVPPKVPAIANPFLQSLEKGEIENFGSHFSDNPHETGSSGDEKNRWKEFTFFRDQFACPKCHGRRLMRPQSIALPLCTKCQMPFSFHTSARDNTSENRADADDKQTIAPRSGPEAVN